MECLLWTIRFGGIFHQDQGRSVYCSWLEVSASPQNRLRLAASMGLWSAPKWQQRRGHLDRALLLCWIAMGLRKRGQGHVIDVQVTRVSPHEEEQFLHGGAGGEIHRAGDLDPGAVGHRAAR